VLDERINSKVAFFIIFPIHHFDLGHTFDLKKQKKEYEKE